MADRIAIMGAGAVGSYVGAFLAREGQDVTLIDMWPEHIEAIRKQGLRASGSQGDFTVPVPAMHLTDAQSIQEPFDYAIISVKSYDTEWATHFIKRYVSPHFPFRLKAKLERRQICGFNSNFSSDIGAQSL